MRKLAVLGVVTLAALGLAWELAGPEPTSLVDQVSEASFTAAGGVFPVFAESEELVGSISLSGDRRRSIAPPFPSRLTFDLHIPQTATLELASALVMMQQVTRARVLMTVDIDDGTERATLFSATYGLAEANQWHEARLDLSRYSGRDVALTFAAVPAGPESDVLWGSRVQVVWGDPRLVREDGRWLNRALSDVVENAAQLGPTEQVEGLDFVVNLVLAGLLSLVPGPRRDGLPAPVRTLFTLSATLMITVVQSSVALALGFLGALSFLRFRTPLPGGAQILHLLYCLGLALAFGTNQLPLGIAAAGTYLLVGSGSRILSWPRAWISRPYSLFLHGSEENLAPVLETLPHYGDLESLELDSGRVTADGRIDVRQFGDIALLIGSARQKDRDIRISVRCI